MENTTQRLKDLLHSESWSSEEQAWLKEYLDGDLSELETLAQEGFEQDKRSLILALGKDESAGILAKLHQHLDIQKNRKRHLPLWVSIAAAMLIVLSVGVYLYSFMGMNKRRSELVLSSHDIVPGKNTATLLLANGKTILLSDSKTGVVIDDSGFKYEDGSTVDAGKDLNVITDLTAATPRGGQYAVTLPDGTKVWLNAASKISFPSRFSGITRKVLLSGEAYFEVAKDKTHPFIVKTDKQAVEVLGTHFNISAYRDEAAMKTTLLEGSVKVTLSQATREIILKPGEQAISNSNTIAIKQADLEEAVAWKNGKFMFDNEPIESIMRKLSRWYDVEVVYKNEVEQLPFTITISRYDNISKILDKIAYTEKIHFKIEGRRITVMQ